MKKALQFLLIFSVLMVCFSHDANAQRKKKKKKSTDEYFDDRGTFAQNLWYGADLNLGFYGVNGGNVFVAGIAPMAGYKITENFSVGPRIEISYRGERYNIGGNEDLKFNSTNYGLGAFTRYKFLETYFVHLEFQELSNEVGVFNNSGQILVQDNKIVTARQWEEHIFIGGGYSSSGGGSVGFQVTLLWDLKQEFSSSNIPLSYRFGINYKF